MRGVPLQAGSQKTGGAHGSFERRRVRTIGLSVDGEGLVATAGDGAGDAVRATGLANTVAGPATGAVRAGTVESGESGDVA
jgi:hypothetical protein